MSRRVRINPPEVDHTRCANCTRLAEEIAALRKLIAAFAAEATWWVDGTFVCFGCQYVIHAGPRSKDCGCVCHEARRRAGLPADWPEESEEK